MLLRMKRLLIGVGLVVVLLLVVVGGLIAWTFMGRKAVVDGVEVGNVRLVADGFVTVGVIDLGNRRVALVDAGNDAGGAAILGDLSRRGLGADAVEAIFLTHGHGDHIAAVPLFPNATVLALGPEAGLVEGREGASGPLTQLMPVSPTGITVKRQLRDGEEVVLGETAIKAFAVPGHTRGSAAYLVNGVLFVGDSADAASDGTLLPSAWIFSDSQAQNRQSLAALDTRLKREGARVTMIAPAHSGALTNGLMALDAFTAVQLR